MAPRSTSKKVDVAQAEELLRHPRAALQAGEAYCTFWSHRSAGVPGCPKPAGVYAVYFYSVQKIVEFKIDGWHEPLPRIILPPRPLPAPPARRRKAGQAAPNNRATAAADRRRAILPPPPPSFTLDVEDDASDARSLLHRLGPPSGSGASSDDRTDEWVREHSDLLERLSSAGDALDDEEDDADEDAMDEDEDDDDAMDTSVIDARLTKHRRIAPATPPRDEDEAMDIEDSNSDSHGPAPRHDHTHAHAPGSQHSDRDSRSASSSSSSGTVRGAHGGGEDEEDDEDEEEDLRRRRSRGRSETPFRELHPRSAAPSFGTRASASHAPSVASSRARAARPTVASTPTASLPASAGAGTGPRRPTARPGFVRDARSTSRTADNISESGVSAFTATTAPSAASSSSGSSGFGSLFGSDSGSDAGSDAHSPAPRSAAARFRSRSATAVEQDDPTVDRIKVKLEGADISGASAADVVIDGRGALGSAVRSF